MRGRTSKERVDVGKTLTIVGETGATVDASGVLYGFKLSAADVQLSGFTIQGASSAGVFLSGATNTTVQNVRTTGGDDNGIRVEGGSGNTLDQVTVNGGGTIGILLRTTDQNTVSNSTTRNNGNHGLSIQGGDGNQVSGVTSSGNSRGNRSATGIDVRGYLPPSPGVLVPATNTLVEGSTTFGNEDSGIEIYPDSTYTTVRRNVTYDNGDHGIDVAGAPNTTVASNTIVGNTHVGLNVEAGGPSGGLVGSTGATLRDNISAENGVTPTTGSQGEIRVDLPSTPGTTMDRDLAWRADGGQLFVFGTTYTASLGGIQLAGQELNGIVADPKFVSLSTRDLHLSVGSPAVDAAFADAPGWRAKDRGGNAPVDDPTVTDTGSGAPSYADIGAYELTGGWPPPPTAKLTANPTTVTTGGSSTLAATGSTGTALTYAFVCGDGGTAASGSTPGTAVCTYTAAGSYTAKVTVTDSNKQTANATTTIQVTDPPAPAPVAKLTVNPTNVTTGGTSTLDATRSTAATGATITGYAFDCANGSAVKQGNSPTAVCAYTKPGSYAAKVTVTDSNNQTGSTTATVTVTDPAPPPPPAPGPGPTSPPPPPGPAPTQLPSAPTARLTATRAQVLAGGTSTLDGSGSTATAPGAALTDYRFDCGNGAAVVNGRATRATCTYPKAGSYTATLTVTDSVGQRAATTTTVTVTLPAPPRARLHLVKKHRHRYLKVRLDASASTGSPDAPPVAFKFYCGNGHHTKWVQRTSASCVYRHHGRHHVKVRVMNSVGVVDAVTRHFRFRR